jgi:hypothetical protein
MNQSTHGKTRKNYSSLSMLHVQRQSTACELEYVQEGVGNVTEPMEKFRIARTVGKKTYDVAATSLSPQLSWKPTQCSRTAERLCPGTAAK